MLTVNHINAFIYIYYISLGFQVSQLFVSM